MCADVSGGALTNVEGQIAHDSPVAGNPVAIGGEARQTLPTAVADADQVRAMMDDLGRLVTAHAARDLVVQNMITLSSSAETTLITAVASVFQDATLLVLSNATAVETSVKIRDDTAGTVRMQIDLAASGGGAVIPFYVPFNQTAINKNWTAQLTNSASAVYVIAQVVKTW